MLEFEGTTHRPLGANGGTGCACSNAINFAVAVPSFNVARCRSGRDLSRTALGGSQTGGMGSSNKHFRRRANRIRQKPLPGDEGDSKGTGREA
jgi:hypothetical protein